MFLLVLSIPALVNAQSPIEILNTQLDSLKNERHKIDNEIAVINSKKLRVIKEQESADKKKELAKGIPIFTKKDVRIHLDRASYSKVIGTLSKNTMIMAYDRQSGYYFIEHDSIVGYVNFMDVATADERAEFENLKVRKAELARIANFQEKQKNELTEQELIRNYGENVARRIIDGEIWLGMTSQMIVDSWGNPHKKNKSVGSWGVNEQWIYSSTYFYIKNGVLTSWQTR